MEIWGTGSLMKPPQTAAIMPVIGVIRDFDVNELKLNEHEVEEAFALSIADLASPTNHYHTQFKSGWSSVIIKVNDYKVWGITGFLTNTFLNCLLPAEINGLRKYPKYVKPFTPKSS